VSDDNEQSSAESEGEGEGEGECGTSSSLLCSTKVDFNHLLSSANLRFVELMSILSSEPQLGEFPRLTDRN
jgi:hypothetical protein